MTYTTTEEEKKKLNGVNPSAADAAAPLERGAMSTQSGTAQNTQQSAQQNTQGGTVQMRYDPASDAAYQQALSALTAANKNAPTYAGSYDGQLADIYDQIVNRDKFSYSVNDDALYQQYAQQYAQAGRLAMQDTMGQAAALTGGYGSSYGQSVGQQQYDAYLQRLNDVVPELYNAAYGRYQDEGNALAQQYAMMGDLRDREYAQYQDAYNRWANERANAQNLEQQAYERGQNDWKVGYTQALDKAETLAKSGDFSGYAELYGQGTADNMRRSWLSANPDLAYRNGMMTAEEYKAMTGEYPAGYVAPNAGVYYNRRPSGRELVESELNDMMFDNESTKDMRDYVYNQIAANTINAEEAREILRTIDNDAEYEKALNADTKNQSISRYSTK